MVEKHNTISEKTIKNANCLQVNLNSAMSTAVEDRKIKNETFRGDNEKLVLSCSETIAKGETGTSVRYDKIMETSS